MAVKQNIVVLLSGGGSNLQALIDFTQQTEFPGNICAVISNKTDAYGLERARRAGIEAIEVNHKDFESRETFEQALKKRIDPFQPSIVVLAGFMRILTPEFVQHYEGRMLNIHPSLLPKYPGLNTHQRAIDAKDTEHGVTVHFVTSELDGGPAVIQARVPILENDTADTLAKRVLVQEHQIYPLAVKWFLERRLIYKTGKALLDGKTIPPNGWSLTPNSL